MAEPAKHYTVKRLAERWACSESFIYKEITEGRLGHMKIGNNYRIPVAQVEAYEERNTWEEKEERKSNTDSSESPEEKATTSPGQKTVFLSAYQRGRETKEKQGNISTTSLRV